MRKEDGVLYDVTLEDLKLLKENPKAFWKGVHTIGENAFQQTGSQLFELIVPKTVKTIKSFAFFLNDNLQRMEVEGVENLEYMFLPFVCNSLKYVKIAKDNINKIERESIPLNNYLTIDKNNFYITEEKIANADSFININLNDYSQAFFSFQNISPLGNGIDYHFYVDELLTNKVFSEISKETLEKLNDLVKDLNKAKIKLPVLFIKNILENNMLDQIKNVKSKNVTKIFKFIDKFGIHSETSADFYKFAMSLGLFEDNAKTQQKAAEFLLEKFTHNELAKEKPKYENLDEKIKNKMNLKPHQIEKYNESVNKHNQTLEEKNFVIKKENMLKFNVNYIHQMFDSMRLEGYNEGFTNFITNKQKDQDGMDNFSLLMKEVNSDNVSNGFNQVYSKSFISDIYNVFDSALPTFMTTPETGVPRLLSPTVNLFKKYFTDNKFGEIKPEYEYIADELKNFTGNEKMHYDRAVSITKKFKRKRIKPSILKSNLVELDILQEVERCKQEIESLTEESLMNSKEALNMLKNIADKEFTYEWLEKNDPKNFTLGQYCHCCAHLGGAGYGIMNASIIHPDVQNLVIKNKAGRIIAKSTLYVNRKAGYGVFNNVEVSDGVGEDKLYKVYETYNRAIKDFANQYNLENPKKPIKKINVGMKMNNLVDQIKQNNQPSDILKSIKFGKFGLSGQDYDGDWADRKEGQYNMWTKDDGQSHE